MHKSHGVAGGCEGGGIAEELVDDDELYAGICEEGEEGLHLIRLEDGAAFEFLGGEAQRFGLAAGGVIADRFLNIRDGFGRAAAEPS